MCHLLVPVLCMKIATAVSILGNDVQMKRLHDFNTTFSYATHVPISNMRVLGIVTMMFSHRHGCLPQNVI